MGIHEQLELTGPQRRFADAVQASPGGPLWGDTVCLYQEMPTVTIRWIIDGDGEVVDQATFGHV